MSEQKIALDALLAGTPLLTFLMELAAIDDSQIADTLEPVGEGEVVLGDMNPLEKRLVAWQFRRKEQTKRDFEALKASKCLVCAACDISNSPRPPACVDVLKFNQETDERFALIWEGLHVRFPDAKNSLGVRAGFTVVTNVKSEKSKSRGGFGITIVSGSGLGSLFASLHRESSMQ
ncbi:MAG: hypothetical protein UT41_C0001G0390 [Candidatus Wolfebacteria bacterium GW2011_GWC2_39_22]|uniref:Uncharacterized protein n=1 Tax=Candidatus Wolfebacteria bacterium GW2011_GWC2_39_22 TaxID=1619013 RepID=A0A0G0NJ30_9BACT|nr:MAG: hypothetical protein UT41_C0001G0390 [Candidatus Wolfebacteria bacterium GW2011_GWC2_39_22]HBI25492.1 hypothetical protein [Candidatus Wolfebacteria bacterium]